LPKSSLCQGDGTLYNQQNLCRFKGFLEISGGWEATCPEVMGLGFRGSPQGRDNTTAHPQRCDSQQDSSAWTEAHVSGLKETSESHLISMVSKFKDDQRLGTRAPP
jgi:hypothetical protein